MPINVGLQVNRSDLAYAEAMLDAIPGGLQRALRAAVTDTLKSGRTLLTKAIYQDLTLARAEVASKIKPSAVGADAVGTITIGYERQPIIDFKGKFTQKGVTAQPVRDSSGVVLKHAFKAKMASGHVGAFERKQGGEKRPAQQGKYAYRTIKRGPRKGQPVARQAIVEIPGPPVVASFEKAPNLADDAVAALGERLTERLMAKVEWQLSRANPNVPDTV
jgi:hypothetical protein